MSEILKPLMTDETGQAIVEALTQQEMTQTRIAEINAAAVASKQEIGALTDSSKQSIETKTDEQVARIPEVTKLSEDVGQLKDDLAERKDLYDSILQIRSTDNILNPKKLINNKDIDYRTGEVIDTTSNKSVSELIEVDPSVQLRVTTGYNESLCQYDETGKKIAFTGKFNSTTPITLEENTKYVRMAIWNSTLPFMLYQSNTNKEYVEYGIYSENVRKIVKIYNSETEEEIFLKLYNALKAGNCDVYWEQGTYEFSTIFELLKTKYGWGTAYELPIGGNCRYYFNGSKLTATAISSDNNVLGNESLMGSIRRAGSYELYDAIFEATGMVYVVHDEASGSNITYTRKYHNIRMHYITDSSKRPYGMCLGGGTGLKGCVDFDGCVFITDADQTSIDGGYHGHGKEDESVFYATVRNCYFSKGFQDGALATNETAQLVFCNNSVPNTSSIPHNDKWNPIVWGNEIRNKLTT